MKRTIKLLLCAAAFFFSISYSNAQTSWTGATSVNWATATNWTAGVPTALTNAIIGDASFTGSFQPTISASSTCNSLTVGGSVNSILTVSSTFTIKGGVTINSNGSMINGSASISIAGNWLNYGSYSTTSSNATIILNGITQSIGGTTVTSFRKLTINAGCTVTLNSNIISTGTSGIITISGTLNPNESPTYQVTTDNLTVNNNAVMKVNASSFAGNYTIATTFTLNAGSIVEYSSTTGNQTISGSYTYSTLRISGTGVKSLSANLPLLRSTSSSTGNIYVLSGTLDLSSYTAARGTTLAGGTFSVSNGAFVNIGSTNSFPASYGTNTLSLTSTVEYNGGNQIIAAKTYGNLILSSSGGAVVKTMTATAFTVAGNFSSSIGAGSGVSYAAAANITVTGSFTIGAGTSFDGATFSHAVSGNWINNGTFTGSTSTITLKGANAVVSGTGVHNFNNLTLSASGISASSSISISISGNLATSGSGVFTQASPGVITMNGTTKTISGTGITLNDLTVTGTISSSSILAFTGNLAVSGTFTSTGSVSMNGTTKTLSGAGTISFKALLIPGSITTAANFGISSSLNVSGSFTASAGTATFTVSSTITGTASLFNVTENGTSLILASNAVLGIANSFTVSAGSLNVTTNVPNTVNYNGTGAQNISARPYNNLILSNGNTKTAAGAITVNNALTIASGTSFAASSYTHTLLGNMVNNGIFVAGTSTVQFTGVNNTTIQGATTFNILTINKTATTNSVSLLNSISVSTINMTNGSLLTDVNSITITTTRSGNGIILGTITRTHAFSTATAYAFEGPYNTIIFASVSGVTSVTVNVTVASVGDFPYGGAINRYYNITVPFGTYTATLRLHYEDVELSGNDESVMQLWKYNGASWGASGKTANSTTLNYVEKSGLTNITDRWSCTDDGSVLSWNGSVDNNWSNASNWSLVQGTFSGAPTSTDIAQVGTASFTNQPDIATSVLVKGLNFGSVQPVALTVSTGGSLTTNGNISGVWTAGTIHSISAGSQNITVNGDIVLSDNTNGHAINLNIGTGTVSVTGSVIESGGANINFSSTGVLAIGKDFTYSSGTFTGGTGTVLYNGAASQIVAGVNYNHLSVTKTAGIASLSSTTSVNGNLSVTAGELNINSNTTIAGSVSISAGAILDANAVTINTGGNWTKTGTFNQGTSTVNINGAGAQTISSGSFNTLTVNKSSGTVSLTGNVAINADLTVNSGTLNLSTFTLNHATLGGNFALANGAVLLVSGAANFPTNYTGYAMASNSLVHYNGVIAQTVEGINYGNLSFSNGAADKTLGASATVDGDLTINSGASFNGGNFAITLNGNWINNGTFIPGTGDIILNGISKTITGNSVFNDVTVNGTYSVAGSDITYNGLLYVTSSGNYAAGSGTATVNGDLTNSGTLTSAGTTTFTGTSLQTIRLINALSSTSTGVVNFNGSVSPVLNSTSTPTFATLNINNTAGINPSVGWTILVAFNISNGAAFNGGVSTHTISRTFTNNGTVTSSGTLNFNPSSNVTLQLNGNSFSSTGTVIFGGSGVITITGTPTSLQDVVIANTNAAGVTPASDWTLGGKFSINNNADFHAASYNYTVAGDIESDGILEGENSTFIMNGSSGNISGSPATTFNHFTVAGNVTANSDFNVAGNFINNGTFDGTIGTVIMTGSNNASISGSTTPTTIAQLTINKSPAATVTAAVDISSVTNLNISAGTFFTSTYAITQNAGGGVLIIIAGATLKLGGTNTIPAFSGYGLEDQSTVDYAGTTQTISNSAIYGNLKISAAGNKTAVNFLPLTILGNFELSAGNFIAGNNTHKLAGNWLMTGGSFNNTASTFQLNGTSDQDINTIAAFNNLTNNKPFGLTTLSSNVSVNNVLTLALGKINVGINNLIIGNAGSIAGASSLKYIIAKTPGSLVQQVATSGSKIFPVGTAVYYIPATVALNASSVTDNIHVGVHDSVYTHGETGFVVTNKCVNATWVISEEVAGGSDATVTMQWPAALEITGFNRALSRHARYSGPFWDYGTTDLAASGSNPYSLSRAGFTSFGDFAVSMFDALPVTWLSVSGRNEKDNNFIHWSTSSEYNSSYFVVEGSEDGIHFTALGNLPAGLNSNSVRQYDFIHHNISSPLNFYRIKQVDIDGKFSYSIIIKISSSKFLTGISLQPNPLVDKGIISIETNRSSKIFLSVYDAAGKQIINQTLNVQSGNNLIPIDLSKHPAGIYFIELVDESGQKNVMQLMKK